MHSVLTEINEHLASTCLEKDRGHLDYEAFLEIFLEISLKYEGY